ncbi:FAD dependent oxidoreductase [Candidatus Koribacter versatilis Ellin345]|uniref:FAD dependent oxidoreductase n=1 Tax=Koribacter versatilis (strain Ellin345) TaxID=204669 RepID=Q1ILF6_KORVE|nr:FAD-binding oxidoreductase [Candidatus Koribacter versatilis]ABF42294.1 FAD dependent oxidoreductase [Candidatus Koribacter versatilis Ellin345]
METAEIVIIGGGIVGSSIAWHLTEAGVTDVVVLERETQQGKGSTGKSMGGVRAQFSTDVNIRMSLYSIPFYAEFDERLGNPAGYRPQGYLFLATKPAHLDYLKANQEKQIALGLKTARMVSGDEIASEYPLLRTDDVLGGAFCSTDGFVDPYSAMCGFSASACDRGVRVWKHAEVIAIHRDANGVCEIETTRGSIATRKAVNAAGAWAASVAKLCNLDLPVEPLRRMLLPTEPFADYPHRAPMTIDMSNGFHFRPESLGFLLAWADPQETRSFDTNFDPTFVEKVLTLAADRVPCFENLAINPKRGWAGLYEMTPDHHPILGEAPGVPGFYLANGFSGHGVMHAPATGKILSDLLLNGRTELIDAELLSLSRFAEDRMIHETAVL